MSEIFIALLLLVLIVVVVAILNYSHKKQKKKSRDKVSVYLNNVIQEAEIVPNYEKQLVHQLVMIDEKNRKLLIIDHKNPTLSHDVFSLDEIKSIKVYNHKETVGANEKGGKSETFTTQLGVEITFEKTGAQKFLILYDYVEHNIYIIAELEQEAWQIQERITKAKNGEPVKA